MNFSISTIVATCLTSKGWLLVILGFGIGMGSVEGLAASDLFDDANLLRIQLEIPAEGMKSLRKESRTYVRATVRQASNVLHDVALRLKGRTGSFRTLDDKPAFTLSFDHFVPEQRFRGLSKIHLNNSVEDPSFLHERMGAGLFRSAGVPAPRVSHAVVELNGRRLGLYVLKEGFAPEFLAHHFRRTDGNLFEPETGPGSDVTGPMRRNSGAGVTDGSDLRRLVSAATQPDLAERWIQLGEILDTDRFLTFMAMEALIGHRDGYGLARNNYRIYHDPDAAKFVFLPSGMDQLLGNADFPLQPHMAGFVAKAVLETSEGHIAFRDRLSVLFTNSFRVELLTNQVRRWASVLARDLSHSESRSLLRESEDLCERIEQRAKGVARQLSQPEPSRLRFTDGVAQLSGWRAVNPPEGGKLDSQIIAGNPFLHIQAGPRTSASWRTKVWLAPGRYRFEAKARVTGVKPLLFGKNNGAFLSVPGHNARGSSPLIGNHDLTLLQIEFDLKHEDSEVELLCYLRARSGEAWFGLKSLRLKRLEP